MPFTRTCILKVINNALVTKQVLFGTLIFIDIVAHAVAEFTQN